MSSRDPIKKKEYNERYYSKNKDKIKKRLKEWYLENKKKEKNVTKKTQK